MILLFFLVYAMLCILFIGMLIIVLYYFYILY